MVDEVAQMNTCLLFELSGLSVHHIALVQDQYIFFEAKLKTNISFSQLCGKLH